MKAYENECIITLEELYNAGADQLDWIFLLKEKGMPILNYDFDPDFIYTREDDPLRHTIKFKWRLKSETVQRRF